MGMPSERRNPRAEPNPADGTEGGTAAQTELDRLRAADRRWGSVAAYAPDYILQFDRAGTISYMNRPAPGFTIQDMIGSNVRRWMEPQNHEDFGRAVEHVFATGELASYESIGSVSGRYYINRISPVIEAGEVESAILITHDVTEWKQAEKRLLEADERYRALVDASFEGLAITVDQRIVAVNRTTAALLGYGPDELIGVLALDVVAPECIPLVREQWESGSEAPYELTLVRKDGSRFPCEVLGRNITYQGGPARISGMRDLTERKRQEEEREKLQQRVNMADRVQTLRRLAGGLAHDFNNLLTVIHASAELLNPLPQDATEVAQRIDEIRLAAERAGELTKQLLVYAGLGHPQREPTDISALCRETVSLLRSSLLRNAEIHLDLEVVPPVPADASQIRQIVMNLVLNATEALPAGRGWVRVRTGARDVTPDELLATDFGSAQAGGRYAFLEVSDTGCGMDQGTLQCMFDPFFTTKATGRGLGLASVQGIARAHEGAIQVRSSPGAGTTFTVFFPVA